MQHSHAKSKKPNASNVMARTNLNTTENLAGVVKLTPRLTHRGWKPRRVNRALIRSNAQIAMVIIKLTPTCVHSGGTDLTGSGI